MAATKLSQDELKKQAAWQAVDYVKSGMKLGLGTGSTAAFAVAFSEMLHVVVSPGRAEPRDSSGTFSGSRARTRASSGASSG